MPLEEGAGFSKNPSENFFELAILDRVNFYEVFDCVNCCLEYGLDVGIHMSLEINVLVVDLGTVDILIITVRGGINQAYL